MKKKMLLLFMIITMAVPTTGCFVYHKPEFRGQIVDSDTKQPIEDAVVVAVYNKRTMGLGAGTLDSIINVKETLTDKTGRFRIPSYTTIINPFSWAIDTTFIIFKHGYASTSGWNLEENLTKGIVKEAEVPWIDNMKLKFQFSPGLIGLPIVRTREEQRHARMNADISGAEVNEQELPLLYKLINEERKNGL